MNIELMNSAANNVRILAASMVEKSKSGHPGGAMGGADFINVLYSSVIKLCARVGMLFTKRRPRLLR
jgi:transketolase